MYVLFSQGNGRLTQPYEALLTITENDSPYGQLEIVSSSVDVEEDQGIVKAKVIRNKGDFGRITLDYKTISQTASSSSGDVVHFDKLQQLKTMGAYSWHAFSAFDDEYVLFASNNRTGPLPSEVDDVSMGEYFGSALFRWQGVLVPLQVRKPCCQQRVLIVFTSAPKVVCLPFKFCSIILSNWFEKQTPLVSPS